MTTRTRMNSRAATVVALVCAALVTNPAAAQSRRSDRLDWLGGCWQRSTAAEVVEEQWTQPRAGALFGIARTVRGDSTVLYEFMRIFDRGDSLIFAAMPNGAPATEFTARDTSSRLIDFRNSAHDFPHRVVYRFVSRDSLEAFIEGPLQGRTRRMDFAYRRVRCEAGRAIQK